MYVTDLGESIKILDKSLFSDFSHGKSELWHGLVNICLLNQYVCDWHRDSVRCMHVEPRTAGFISCA